MKPISGIGANAGSHDLQSAPHFLLTFSVTSTPVAKVVMPVMSLGTGSPHTWRVSQDTPCKRDLSLQNKVPAFIQNLHVLSFLFYLFSLSPSINSFAPHFLRLLIPLSTTARRLSTAAGCPAFCTRLRRRGCCSIGCSRPCCRS